MQAVILILAVIFPVSELAAFDAHEHRRLSDRALVRAAALVEASPAMEQALAEVRTQVFGEITVAADWFQCPECVLAGSDYEERLRARERNRIRRGFAAHHNDRHFGREALAAWYDTHLQARACAAEDPARALRLEAIAIHYLQDFFSAGHLATPRRGMHDAAAGDLHDHFNRIGVPFSVRHDERLEPLLATLTENERALWTSAAQGQGRFHGDGALEANPEQTLFVELVAALSISEVLRPGSIGEYLSPCFTQRTYLPKSLAAVPPEGAIAFSESQAAPSPCVPDVWFGRYRTEIPEQFKMPGYDLVGLILRSEVGFGARSDGVRVTTDLLRLSMADDPGMLTGGGIAEYLTMQLGSFGPSYVRGDGYSAWGWQFNTQHDTPVDGLSWGMRWGPRRYTHGPGDSYRLDFGVESSFGIDVIAARIAIDRAHSLHPNDRFASDYIFNVGLSIASPESWTRYLGPVVGRLLRFAIPSERPSEQPPAEQRTAR